MSDSNLSTTRFDPRYPEVNQAQACFRYYCDFYKCQRLLGESHEPCNLLKTYFKTICPNFWVEKWDDQRADGTFPGSL